MKLITLVLACIACATLTAQNTFTIDRLFVPKKQDLPFDPSITIALPAQGYTAKEKDDFKKSILIYIRVLIDNLQDDSLYLKEDYEKIWPGFHTTLLDEAGKLRDYLQTNANPGIRLIYVPSPVDIENLLREDTNLSRDQNSISGSGEKEIRLLGVDPVKKFIYEWVNTHLITDPWISKNMDIAYKKSWREIEAAFSQMKESLDVLTAIQRKPYVLNYSETDMADEILSKWSGIALRNNVIKKIRASAQLQKMLWFTGGIIHMNPLLTTIPQNKYPETEKNTFLKFELIHLIDSLEKKDWPEQLFKTKKIINAVKIPVKDGAKNDVNIVQFDAKTSYTQYAGEKEFISKIDKLVVVVHNVTADQVIDITKTEEELPEMGKVMTAVADIAGEISKVTSSLSPILGSAGKLIQLIQPTPLKSVRMQITVPADKTMAPIDHKMNKVIDETFAPLVETEKLYSLPSLSPDLIVEVGNKKIWLTGQSNADKKRILVATYYPDPNIFFTLDSTYVFLIDKFIEYHEFRKINYGRLRYSVNQLIDDYRRFVRPVEEYEDKLCDLTHMLANAINEVRPYVRISNRSLPPPKIEESVDKKPLYRTVIKAFELPEASKKINYFVVERDKEKEVKTSIKNSVKVVKKVFFDISAGLAFTAPNYTITENGSDNMPQRVAGNRFQFIAGAHIYPWGLVKQNDSWFTPFKERFSMFAGMSFNKPLDNYYFGGSYDIVPGLRGIIGAHFYRNTRYKIVNNEVAEQARGLQVVGGFVSLNIEPIILINVVGLIK